MVAFLLAAMVGISGCWALKYADISERPDYQHLIGTRYVSTGTMRISGVNLPPGYGPEIDIYTLEPSLDWDWTGPERISRETLPVGTTMTVESVWRCTNCPFENRIMVRVAVKEFAKEVDVPIKIDIKYLAPPYVRSD